MSILAFLKCLTLTFSSKNFVSTCLRMQEPVIKVSRVVKVGLVSTFVLVDLFVF